MTDIPNVKYTHRTTSKKNGTNSGGTRIISMPLIPPISPPIRW